MIKEMQDFTEEDTVLVNNAIKSYLSYYDKDINDNIIYLRDDLLKKLKSSNKEIKNKDKLIRYLENNGIKFTEKFILILLDAYFAYAMFDSAISYNEINYFIITLFGIIFSVTFLADTSFDTMNDKVFGKLIDKLYEDIEKEINKLDVIKRNLDKLEVINDYHENLRKCLK